ncbi:MAG: TonB-dependent receptor [Candidatus Methylacidiphilales bacterium]|nr:TonB-dependent receptor [Candidatus Methylacidiphilales bacterium]
MWIWSGVLWLLVWVGAAAAVQEPIVVRADADRAGVSPTVPSSRLELERLAGAVSVEELERVQEGAPATLADSLLEVPGLYSRSRNGSAQTRFSLRGSGLARNADTRGIALQLDGLPLNVSDADFDFLGAVEPLALSHVRVFRSANSAGGVTNALGGSLDFITRTGRDLPQAEARTEFGSYGSYRQHVAGGWATDTVDGFASLTNSTADGFRQHGQLNRQHATVNLGWGDPGHWENRLYYTGFQSDEELPGALTLAQIGRDRRQAASSPAPAFDRVLADWRDELVWHRVADRFAWQGTDDRIEGGAWFTASSIRNPRNRVFDTDGWDSGARVKWTREAELAGRPQLFSASLTGGAAGNEETSYENTGGGNRGAVVDDTRDRFANSDLFLQHDVEFVDRWHLVTSLHMGYALRALSDRVVGAGEQRTADEVDYFLVNPAIGVVFRPVDDVQVYANAAHAQEPPTQADLYRVGAANFFPLDVQQSTTLEIGSRGTFGKLAWDAAFYHAWLEDEYLITENAPGSTDTRNTPESIHRGIESEVSWEFLQPVDNVAGHSVRLTQQATWNDFHLVGDPQFGSNRIAGVPEVVLRSALELRHGSGFYLVPEVQVQPLGIPVDYANSLKSDAFALFGFRAGYGKPQGIQVFFEAQNLGDDTFIADVSVIADAGGADRRVFFPGTGRAFYGGVSWKW